MERLSIRTRLTVLWTVSFGLLLAVALAVVQGAWGAMSRARLDAQLRTLAATDAASAIDGPVGVHLHDLPDAGPGEAAGKFGQVLKASGEVAASFGLPAGSAPLVSGEALRRALSGHVPLSTVRVAGRPGRLALLGVDKDGARWVVAVGLWTDRLEEALGRLALLLVAVWAVSLALTAALGFWLASRALAPVARITERAAFIARGNFAARLDPPRADDEVGRMTRLLNEVLERLGGALEGSRRFAADASHELRGPLTAMLGEVDVTLKRDRGAAEYRSALETVRRQAAALVELTGNLMLLARAQEARAEGLVTEVPLLPLLEESAERLRSLAASRGVTLHVEATPPLLAYAEPGLLARAFDNLLRNAIQYNRDGGTVLVTAEAGPEPGGEGDASERLGGGAAGRSERWEASTVVVRVADTGTGVPESESERIFERFHRVDRSRSRRTGGTGLGLSIAREVARLFGGTLVLAASSPEGSVFELRLPGRPADEAGDGTVGPGPAPLPAS